MNLILKSSKLIITLGMLIISLLSGLTAQATIVEFTTNQGNFQVNLYDQNTPNTVTNFLDYGI